MGYGESFRLMVALQSDTSSHVAAAVAGWQYPVSRESLVLADLYDAFVAANSRKGHTPKPYPRPWDAPRRFGRATRPQSEVRAALRARGHDV